MRSTEPSSDPAPAGTDVMSWLGSDEAARVATRVAARWGLQGWDAQVDTVLADAQFAMWRRMRSTTPLKVRNPAAYGTTAIKSVVRQVVSGRDRADLHLDDERAAAVADTPVTVDVDDPTIGDDLRVLTETMETRPARRWLTAATLNYLTMLMYPDDLPAVIPQPKAGATEDQARGWAALWLAGQRDLFPAPGADPAKRTRARRVVEILDHIGAVLDRARFERDGHRG